MLREGVMKNSKEVEEILAATRARPCGKGQFTERALALYAAGVVSPRGEFAEALCYHAAMECRRCKNAVAQMTWATFRVPNCPEKFHEWKLDRVARSKRASAALKKEVLGHVSACAICKKFCRAHSSYRKITEMGRATSS